MHPECSPARQRGSLLRPGTFLLVPLALGLWMGGGVSGRDPNQDPAGGPAAPANSSRPFADALKAALAKRGLKPETVCDLNDAVARRILEEYGAVFLADGRVRVPPVCMFAGEADVAAFQRQVRIKSAAVGGATIELQAPAMEALLKARDEARRAGLDLTPRGGAEAARRGYADTLRLWKSRVEPALDHWRKSGRLAADEASRLRALPPRDQIRAVLDLEAHGLWFNTDFSKSILYSVAAPGTSQHLSLLALDVTEFADARVRGILARHGWFQTVKSDQPHFTYLGVDEAQLPALGLRSTTVDGQLFWIPNVDANPEKAR